jgi:hypothetical protein
VGRAVGDGLDRRLLGDIAGLRERGLILRKIGFDARWDWTPGSLGLLDRVAELVRRGSGRVDDSRRNVALVDDGRDELREGGGGFMLRLRDFLGGLDDRGDRLAGFRRAGLGLGGVDARLYQ